MTIRLGATKLQLPAAAADAVGVMVSRAAATRPVAANNDFQRMDTPPARTTAAAPARLAESRLDPTHGQDDQSVPCRDQRPSSVSAQAAVTAKSTAGSAVCQDRTSSTYRAPRAVKISCWSTPFA